MINRRKFLKQLLVATGIITIPTILNVAPDSTISYQEGRLWTVNPDPIADIKAMMDIMAKDTGLRPNWMIMNPRVRLEYEIAVRRSINRKEREK